jgi:hypothetical protein
MKLQDNRMKAARKNGLYAVAVLLKFAVDCKLPVLQVCRGEARLRVSA